MPLRRTFAQRIGFSWPCIASAAILSDEPLLDEQGQTTLPSLRQEASHDGLCYLSVKRYLPHADLYEAHVAASPERVKMQPIVVFLTEEHLYYAYPYDIRISGMQESLKENAPLHILTLLQQHAATLQPLTKMTPLQEVPAPLPVVSLIPLDTVEVTPEELQEALAQVAGQGKGSDSLNSHTNPFRVQQALLCAAIDTLMHQLYQTHERAQALTIKARCALLAQLQRWHRCARQDRIVNAVPWFSPQRHQVMWRLIIGQLALA